jgi:hypothetical protein
MFKVQRHACPVRIDTYCSAVVATLAYCANQTIISFSEAVFNRQRTWDEVQGDMRNSKVMQLVFSRHIRQTFVSSVPDFHKEYGDWLDNIVMFLGKYWDELYRDPDREERVESILYGQTNLNMFHFEFVRKEGSSTPTHVNVRLRDNDGTLLNVQPVEFEIGTSKIADFMGIPDYPVFGEIKTTDNFLTKKPKEIGIIYTRMDTDFPTLSSGHFTQLRYDT